MTKKSKLPKTLLETSPWGQNSTPIWPTSTFILHRNLAHQRFPEKLEENELNQIKNKIKNILLKSKVLEQPLFLDFDELSQRDREYLYEHFNTLQEMKTFRSGQGICLDATGRLLITINFIDHICIHMSDSNSEWTHSYQKMNALDQELNQCLTFAYSDQFGFLTSDPSFCGTGLVIESMLHLPLILGDKQPVEVMSHIDNGIMLSSITRNLDFAGDIGIIQNNYTLGTSEEQILHLLHTNALTLMNLEQDLQRKLQEKPSPEVKDRVARALATLKSSFKIETKEALFAISTLKLGLQLGWIDGITMEEVHKLFFDIQRAHLLQLSQDEPPIKQLPEHRSNFLKQSMEKLSFTL